MADSTASLGEEIFHQLQLVLKESSAAHVLSVDTPAADALKLLEQVGRSHLAVMNGDTVVGLFSFRSFALNAIALAEVEAHEPLGTLPVEHFLEEAAFRSGGERLDDAVMHALRDVGAVIVGEGRVLDGVATLDDVADHLFRFAQPFVLVAEVEHALRALIQHATTPEELAAFARAVLRPRRGVTPTTVSEMSFGEYQQVILADAHFPKFQPTFGGTATIVESKLEPVREIRNKIFHFKEVLGRVDYTTLKNTRNWLSRRLAACSGGVHV